MTAATRSKHRHRYALLVATGLVACHAGPNPAAPDADGDIITLAAGSQCGRGEASADARWLDSAEALQDTWQRMTRHSIGKTAFPAPVPDFVRYGVLLVSMGQRTTGGYRLRLLSPRLEHTPAAATVRVAWLAPPPGARTAQVITSPCLLLAIPRGRYPSITVTDQAGRTRAVADRQPVL